ncbi:polymorphic toxin-type HINT domain-containing protein, partial [Kitasatospora sp. NPDC015120]|uniref:polymorphic toxin-type HINT domain-containing protein n=1 Tax=Kitasatospora sp. NPDC015120 TaxID=3364023 RepID=UPI0036F4ACAC
SPYDYCTGDPVNCTDLDGNWGMPKWLKKTVQVIAVVAEVASNIPGPIGAVAAAVSSVSYAATGNWAKAAEMAVTAVAATVGAGPVVKVAAAAVKTTRASGRVQKAASAARAVFRRGCNSFDPSTPVLMADGSYLPISRVQAGDQVASADPETGELRAEPVLAVLVTYTTKHMVEFDTDLDPTTPGVRATSYHPVWVEDRGWVQAGDLRIGDPVVAADGTALPLTRIVDEGDLPDQLVYNLNVGDLHTYFVQVGDSSAIVHNASCLIGGNNSAAVLGKRAHKQFETYAKARGWKSEVTISAKSRVDAVRNNGKRMVELKSTKRSALTKGRRQLRRYMKETKTCSSELWTYTHNKTTNNFHFRQHEIVKSKEKRCKR